MGDEKVPGTIRAARLDKSRRLQKVFRLLADGQEHSTWEIVQALRVAGHSAAVAELRAEPNNITIHHRHRDGGNWYRMERNAMFHHWLRTLDEENAGAVNG